MKQYYTTHTSTACPVHRLQVDPLADKYPGWSPYNYCLNNPLGIVDPDGREIQVNSGEKDSLGKPIYYTYKDGAFFKDGKKVEKSSYFLGLLEQYDGFLGQVFSALQRIEKGSDGKNLVGELVAKEEIIYKIEETTGRSYFEKDNKTIYWNTSGQGYVLGDFDQEINMPADIELAHELIHAHRNMNNLGDYSEWGIIGDLGIVTNDELPTCVRENIIRAEQGLKRRAYYYYKKSFIFFEKFMPIP